MKSILITGANRGLGLSLAKAFDSLGYQLNLVVRNQQTEQPLKALFPSANILVSDITLSSYENTLKDFLGDRALDVIINNAGSGSQGNSLETVLTEQLITEFNTHCVAALATIKGAIDNLRQSSTPLILNISSRRGSLSMQAEGEAKESGTSFSYRIGKASQNMLTLCLVDELSPQGITVAAIHPGQLLTDMSPKDAQMTPEESATIISQWVLLNKINAGDFISVETGKLPW